MKSGKVFTFKRSALSVAIASAFALGSMGLVGNAYAADNATSTATSTVVTPTVVAAAAVLSFGSFAPDAGGGTVTIRNNGVRTVTGGILEVAGGTHSAAKFDVTGALSTTYGISYTGTVSALTHTDNSTTMALALTGDLLGGDNVNAQPSSGTLSASGAESIYVGGTLTVAQAQKAGVYTGAITVTVAYN